MPSASTLGDRRADEPLDLRPAPGPRPGRRSRSARRGTGARPAAVRWRVSPSGIAGGGQRAGARGRGRDSRARTPPRARCSRNGESPIGTPSTFVTTSSRIRPSATRPPSARAAATGDLRIVGGGQHLERAPAALEVERGHPVDEDDVRAGGALQRRGGRPRRDAARGCAAPYGFAGSAAASRWTARSAGSARGLAERPQPLDRAGEGELGRAETVDEVAAPDPAGLLQGAEHGIDRREPAVDALAGHAVAGHDPLAIEQRERRGVDPFRRRARRRRRRATSVRRPPADPARSGGPGRRRTSRADRFQRSARSGANVSFVTSPAQTRSQSASRTSRSEPPPAAAYSSR